MKQRPRLLIRWFNLFCCLAMAGSIYAQSAPQEIMAADGGYTEIEGYSISWTVGDISVQTLSKSTVVNTQGFQQSFVSLGDIVLDQKVVVADSIFQMAAFPNPAYNEVTVLLPGSTEKEMQLQVYDLRGLLLQTHKIDAGQTSFLLQLGEYSAGTFLLSLRTSNDLEIVATGRVIKIQ